MAAVSSSVMRTAEAQSHHSRCSMCLVCCGMLGVSTPRCGNDFFPVMNVRLSLGLLQGEGGRGCCCYGIFYVQDKVGKYRTCDYSMANVPVRFVAYGGSEVTELMSLPEESCRRRHSK